jgi:hypothetical protein
VNLTVATAAVGSTASTIASTVHLPPAIAGISVGTVGVLTVWQSVRARFETLRAAKTEGDKKK